MLDTTFLNQLDRFHLIVKKRVTSSYTGSRRAYAKGQGVVIQDYRMYAPGDDFRAIDWKLYARTDNLYVRQYEEERNLTVHIIVDASASMDFGKPVTKFEYAAMLGVGFAFLSMKDNEKFRFSTFSDNLNLFQSRRGLNQLAAMIEHLNSVKPRGLSRLGEVAELYKKSISSKAMIVLISDFLINPEEIRTALHLFRKHELKVIQVLDASEKKLGFEGDYTLHDSETHESLQTYISPAMRQKYQEKLDEHIASISETCDKLGCSFYSLTTDKPVFDSFYEMLRA